MRSFLCDCEEWLLVVSGLLFQRERRVAGEDDDHTPAMLYLPLREPRGCYRTWPPPDTGVSEVAPGVPVSGPPFRAPASYDRSGRAAGDPPGCERPCARAHLRLSGGRCCSRRRAPQAGAPMRCLDHTCPAPRLPRSVLPTRDGGASRYDPEAFLSQHDRSGSCASVPLVSAAEREVLA